MWLVLLPLPSLLMGLLAAGFRRRGGRGCVFIGGVLIWPQAALLQKAGLTPGMAWLVALALMVAVPVVGYRLGMRLLPPSDRGEAPER